MHVPERKIFCCLLCAHNCASEFNMRIHVTEVHAPKKDFYLRAETAKKTCRKLIDTDVKDQPTYTCQICLKSFRKKCYLHNHSRCHRSKLENVNALNSQEESPNCRMRLRKKRENSSQKKKCAEDVIAWEPRMNEFQKSGTVGSSSIGGVNFWPRVVLSSDLNLLLSRSMELMEE